MKSVLESILVYWLSVAPIPKGILNKIRKRCFSFLQSGSGKQKTSHLLNGQSQQGQKSLEARALRIYICFQQGFGCQKSMQRFFFNKGLFGKQPGQNISKTVVQKTSEKNSQRSLKCLERSKKCFPRYQKMNCPENRERG